MISGDTGAGRAPLTRYDATAMTLHWLIAAGVILNIALGFYMGDVPRTDPMKAIMVTTHESIGLTILGLSVVRLAWRLIHRFLPLPADLPAVLKLAARATYVTFYALMFLLPLSGWLMASGSSRPMTYFWLFGWPKFSFYDGMAAAQKHHLAEDVFGSSHTFLAWVMIVLAVLHIGAALYHRFVRRDEVWSHMVPGV